MIDHDWKDETCSHIRVIAADLNGDQFEHTRWIRIGEYKITGKEDISLAHSVKLKFQRFGGYPYPILRHHII